MVDLFSFICFFFFFNKIIITNNCYIFTRGFVVPIVFFEYKKITRFHELTIGFLKILSLFVCVCVCVRLAGSLAVTLVYLNGSYSFFTTK